MRTWLVVLLLATAFSGCTEEPNVAVEPSTGTDGNETVEPEVNVTQVDGTQATRAAPILLVTASVVNGTAPLVVNFTIDAQNASANASWTFFMQGNETASGTTLTAAVNHTFDAGSWNVTFLLTDGEHASNETMVVTVAAGEVADAFIQEVSGTFTAGVHGCINNAYPNVNQGITFFQFAPDERTWGQPFMASFTPTGPAVDYTVHFWKGTGTVVGTFTSDSGTVEGVVPDGTDGAYLNACGGVEVDATYLAGAI